MQDRRIRILAGILLGAGAAGLFAVIAASPQKFERDFATYYYAAAAYAGGENPYDARLNEGGTAGPTRVMFVYPPHILPLFGWTNGLPYEQARLIWLAAKGAFLLLLLLLWSKILKPDRPDVYFYAFAALAFNGAVLIDLTTGNVTIIEQALLWGGFFAFTKKRWLTFALLVAASALFKVTNGLFLLLLASMPLRKTGPSLAAGALGLAAPLAISLARWPGLFDAFLKNAGGLMQQGERGSSNPCLWAFLADTRDVMASLTGWEIRVYAVEALFVLHALFVLLLTSRAVRTLIRTGGADGLLVAVALSSLAFPLIVPRFKDYSFVLLVPAAYMLIRRAGPLRLTYALVAFIVCLPTVTSFRLLMPAAEYHLLFVTYGLWILMLMYIRAGYDPGAEEAVRPAGAA